MYIFAIMLHVLICDRAIESSGQWYNHVPHGSDVLLQGGRCALPALVRFTVLVMNVLFILNV